MESWSYSSEWVWNPRTKLCCNVSREWNVSRVSLREFGVYHIIFWIKLGGDTLVALSCYRGWREWLACVGGVHV